jgi:hypothetical protein
MPDGPQLDRTSSNTHGQDSRACGMPEPVLARDARRPHPNEEPDMTRKFSLSLTLAAALAALLTLGGCSKHQDVSPSTSDSAASAAMGASSPDAMASGGAGAGAAGASDAAMAPASAASR